MGSTPTETAREVFTIENIAPSEQQETPPVVTEVIPSKINPEEQSTQMGTIIDHKKSIDLLRPNKNKVK